MGKTNLDFATRVVMYLDGELSKQEEQNLLMEIKKSPEYLEKFRIESSFREFLRSKISRRNVSPLLVQNIKEKIKSIPS